MVSGIGGNQRVVFQHPLHRRHDGDQQLLFAARAVRLRFDDDLVLRINGGHTGVALYHAL